MLARARKARYTHQAMPPKRPLPVGKLPPSVLKKLLRSCTFPKSSGVILGPRYGEDAAVVAVGGKCLVAKTDPITFTGDRSGWYAVNINANDLAALGARPRWFLATFLLPERKTTAATAQRLFEETLKACRDLDVSLCGGHTEVTSGLDRPIVVGLMLGEVEKAKLVRKSRQRPGDAIILTKGVAIEGTAILAREKAGLLRKKLGTTFVRHAQRLRLHPGISVVRDAQVALKYGGIHAMHDPTEGGLVTALYELADSANVGIEVWKEKIPVLPETQALARTLGFDPLALLASGALLIVAGHDSGPRVVHGLLHHGIRAEIIGKIRGRKDGISITEGRRKKALRIPAQDEIARLLSGASCDK